MDFQQQTTSWRTVPRSWVKKVIPERQVHLRTDGRVIYFRISTLVQVLSLGIFLSASSWIGITTYSYVKHDKILASNDNLLTTARVAYESLLNEVADYQNKFNAITLDLEHNHALMLSLVERNASLQKNLRTISSELEACNSER